MDSLSERYNETEAVLSSITVMELEHGWYRAISERIAHARRVYLDDIFEAIPVVSFTREMALLAARIDADSRKIGRPIPITDVQIGATAVHLDYALVTADVRHFSGIHELEVLSL